MKDTLAYHIAALYRDFLSYTNDELKKLGISFGQIPQIIYTGKHPNCTQADLTKALRLDWGYSQRSITKLAEGGFIVKEYDTQKAGNCLNLTETGRNAFDVCHTVFQSWDFKRTKTLTDEQKELLILLLGKITQDETES